MEFWGLEIKPEETVKVEPGENKYLHLSQASLGETKKDKGNENVLIYVKFNNQKLVLGTLSTERCAQIQCDLIFEKEFELSHNSKNASVYLCGYKTLALEEDEFPEFDESDSDADEDIQLDQKANGKSDIKDEQAKSTAGKPNVLQVSATKAKPKTEELKKADKQRANKDDDDEEEDDDDEESEEDESDDEEDMMEMENDSEDEDGDESSDEEDETTVKSAELSKKRSAGSALKTPVPEKKAKLISPVESQKKGGVGKKGSHSATPHPAKQSGKTPNNDKAKQQTPKSTGSISCKSCGKTFNSDNGLQAHTKAKHSAAK